jgi:hypothetical protein
MFQDDWWLCRNIGCRGRIVPMTPFGDEFIIQWLRGLRPDASKILQMRTILAAEFGSAGLVRMSDHMVLIQIARLLKARLIHVHRATDPAGRPQVQPQGAKTAESSRPARPPRRQFVPNAPFREPPVDPPTFLADIDLPVQAATLIAAASSGKPFCPE